MDRTAKVAGANLRTASAVQKKAYAELRKAGWEFDGPPAGNSVTWLSLVRVLAGGKCEFCKIHGDGRVENLY